MKIILLAGIIVIWIAGFIVAIYGFRSIAYFSLEIAKNTQHEDVEILKDYPLCLFLKDLYVNVGIWENIIWCLFIVGVLLFVVYGYCLYKSKRGGQANTS